MRGKAEIERGNIKVPRVVIETAAQFSAKSYFFFIKF